MQTVECCPCYINLPNKSPFGWFHIILSVVKKSTEINYQNQFITLGTLNVRNCIGYQGWHDSLMSIRSDSLKSQSATPHIYAHKLKY